MAVSDPRLWCAAPEIDPGSVKIDWLDNGNRESMTLAGRDAEIVLQQWSAARTDRARRIVLEVAIETREVAHV